MDTFLKDIKQALRMLLKNPAFTATALAALTLGIGVNAAIFSVVNTVLLKPLPYPEPGRLVFLMNTGPRGSFPGASVPKFNVWRAQSQILKDVSAYDVGGPGVNIGGGDKPEQVKGIHVSEAFFRLFGVPLVAGRGFSVDEDRPRGGNVALISEGLWKRRFASQPGITGKTLLLGGEPYTIIGVVGSSFNFEPSPDLYLPFQADPTSNEHAHFFTVAGRLAPGVGLGGAKSAMQAAASEFRQRFPGALGPQAGFSVEPMQEIVVRNVRTALYVLLGAVGFVLLIACANVASLLLARASARAREIAIRSALGAGRGRIIRQLLTESLVLSIGGGLLGLALGAAGVKALLAINPGGIPRIGPDGAGVSLDWTAVAFTLTISLLTGVLFGLAPAIFAARSDLNLVLKNASSRSGGGAGQNRTRSLLVVVEMALAIVLLVGAGLLIRTFAALQTVAPGFDSHNVLTMSTSLSGSKFDKTAAIADLARQATERIEALPGVQAAAGSCYLPLEGGLGLPFAIEGRPLTDGAASHGGAGWAYVTPRFFDVFKVAVVRGRAFTQRDDTGAPGVVIINEAFARQFWSKENPIGQRLRVGPGMGPVFNEAPREVVGVVADARDGGLNSDPQPQMFVPVAQVRDSVMALNNRFMPLSWVIRTNAGPFTLSAPVQRVFQDLADMPVANVRSMDQVVSESTARNRFNTMLLGIFAFSAIALASIGLYGLMAYSVQQRRVEFGIRLALGADGASVRNLIVRQAMVLAAIGLVIGMGAAFGLTRWMSTLLFDVKPTDPLVFGTVAALHCVVAFLAAFLPARKAVRIDPIVALRYE